MIDITVLARSPHQLACARAVAAGVAAAGGRAALAEGDRAPTQQVCCWGWRKGARLRAAGHDVLVMERGYLGDRFAWFSLGWNGLNGRATFPGFRDDGTRFRQNHGALLRPWASGGRYALLVGQVPGDASLQGRNLQPWYREAAAELRAAGMTVRYRPHPVALKRGNHVPAPPGAETDKGPLSEALAGAALCVTWNSNTAVEAVLAGVPTVTIDPGAMAWPVSAHRIGDVVRPDREAWAADLAWKQWRLDEIAAGLPFKDPDA